MRRASRHPISVVLGHLQEAFNLFIHLVNVLLVHRLISRLTGLKEVAWLAALLFALHPMHTEAVTWVKNRSELLALFFSSPIHSYSPYEGLMILLLAVVPTANRRKV